MSTTDGIAPSSPAERRLYGLSLGCLLAGSRHPGTASYRFDSVARRRQNSVHGRAEDQTER